MLMKNVFLALALLVAAGCGKNTVKPGTAGVGGGKDGPGVGAKGGDTLMPLAVGNEWTYELSGEGAINWCPIPGDKLRSSKVIGVETKGGERLFTTEGILCGTTPVKSQMSSQGNKVWSHAMGQKYQILDTPVDGGTFNIATNRYQWKKLGSVSTPAGSFSDCWRSTLLTGAQTTYTDYCRGVGMVTYYIRDLQGNSVTAKLVKKNF